jgi:hypothetical protein
MEAKFIPLERRIKDDGITRYEIFQKNSRVHPLGHEGNKEILEGLKVEPIEEKLRGYKSNWLRHATNMKNKIMPKIMLNYEPTTNGQQTKRTWYTVEETIRRGQNRSIKT